jgi:hypothetical protein
MTRKVLEADSRADLSITELKELISDLEQRYTGKEVVKFNVSWIVEEERGHQ